MAEFKGNVYRNVIDTNAWSKKRQEEALEPNLPIIDPHHHLWDDAHRGRYLADQLAEDVNSGHNVVATVFVETGSMYRADGPPEEKYIGEVEFANGVAAISANGRYSKPRFCAGIVGRADLMMGSNVKPVLEKLVAAGNGRFRGVRFGVNWDSSNARAGNKKPQSPPHRLLDPTFRQGFGCLEQLGLSFDCSTFYPQAPEVADLLRAYPRSNVILNHVGGVLGIAPHDNRPEIFKVWRDNMRELAPFENMTVKVGGLGMLRLGWDYYLRETPPSSEELAAAWRPYVETCIEIFGVNRCMMESNFPPDKQTCGYGVLWNALKRITRDCSAAEKAALYHDTAARAYRLDL